MFKPHTVLGLGLWLIAIDFLGVPSVWKVRLYLVTGVILSFVYLYHLGRETILKLARRQHADTFTENGGRTHENKTASFVEKP